MSSLTILNTTIRQTENLFSLNDLHVISGSENKHRPALFIRLDTTQELVTEIKKEDPNNPVVVCKNGIGTYACMEIALAYAMWIDPKFHLIVLRTYMAMKNDELQNSQPTLPLAEPEPEKTYDTNTTAKEIHELVWLLFSHEQMRSLLEHLYKPLEAIGSRYSGAIYGNYTEYKRHYDKCLPILKRFVEQIKADNPKAWEGLQYRLTAK